MHGGDQDGAAVANGGPSPGISAASTPRAHFDGPLTPEGSRGALHRFGNAADGSEVGAGSPAERTLPLPSSALVEGSHGPVAAPPAHAPSDGGQRYFARRSFTGHFSLADVEDAFVRFSHRAETPRALMLVCLGLTLPRGAFESRAIDEPYKVAVVLVAVLLTAAVVMAALPTFASVRARLPDCVAGTYSRGRDAKVAEFIMVGVLIAPALVDRIAIIQKDIETPEEERYSIIFRFHTPLFLLMLCSPPRWTTIAAPVAAIFVWQCIIWAVVTDYTLVEICGLLLVFVEAVMAVACAALWEQERRAAFVARGTAALLAMRRMALIESLKAQLLPVGPDDLDAFEALVVADDAADAAATSRSAQPTTTTGTGTLTRSSASAPHSAAGTQSPNRAALNITVNAPRTLVTAPSSVCMIVRVVADADAGSSVGSLSATATLHWTDVLVGIVEQAQRFLRRFNVRSTVFAVSGGRVGIVVGVDAIQAYNDDESSSQQNTGPTGTPPLRSMSMHSAHSGAYRVDEPRKHAQFAAVMAMAMRRAFLAAYNAAPPEQAEAAPMAAPDGGMATPRNAALADDRATGAPEQPALLIGIDTGSVAISLPVRGIKDTAGELATVLVSGRCVETADRVSELALTDATCVTAVVGEALAEDFALRDLPSTVDGGKLKRVGQARSREAQMLLRIFGKRLTAAGPDSAQPAVNDDIDAEELAVMATHSSIGGMFDDPTVHSQHQMLSTGAVTDTAAHGGKGDPDARNPLAGILPAANELDSADTAGGGRRDPGAATMRLDLGAIAIDAAGPQFSWKWNCCGCWCSCGDPDPWLGHRFHDELHEEDYRVVSKSGGLRWMPAVAGVIFTINCVGWYAASGSETEAGAYIAGAIAFVCVLIGCKVASPPKLGQGRLTALTMLSTVNNIALIAALAFVKDFTNPMHSMQPWFMSLYLFTGFTWLPEWLPSLLYITWIMAALWISEVYVSQVIIVGNTLGTNVAQAIVLVPALALCIVAHRAQSRAKYAAVVAVQDLNNWWNRHGTDLTRCFERLMPITVAQRLQRDGRVVALSNVLRAVAPPTKAPDTAAGAAAAAAGTTSATQAADTATTAVSIDPAATDRGIAGFDGVKRSSGLDATDAFVLAIRVLRGPTEPDTHTSTGSAGTGQVSLGSAGAPSVASTAAFRDLAQPLDSVARWVMAQPQVADWKPFVTTAGSCLLLCFNLRDAADGDAPQAAVNTTTNRSGRGGRGPSKSTRNLMVSDMRLFATNLCRTFVEPRGFTIRTGFGSGRVRGGFVGNRRQQYAVAGEATAAAMDGLQEGYAHLPLKAPADPNRTAQSTTTSGVFPRSRAVVNVHSPTGASLHPPSADTPQQQQQQQQQQDQPGDAAAEAASTAVDMQALGDVPEWGEDSSSEDDSAPPPQRSGESGTAATVTP